MGKNSLRLFALVLTFSAIVGCNSGPPGVPAVTLGSEVEGTITLNDEPLPNGIISFVPPDGGGGGTGVAILNGKFHVREDSGLQPGKYRVEIRWGKPTGKKIPAGYMELDETREGVPEQYNAKSELFVEIPKGKSTRDFQLVGEVPAPKPDPASGEPKTGEGEPKKTPEKPDAPMTTTATKKGGVK